MYEGNFLRKIKGVSLAILTTPFLFSGCMQEKISTIVPVKSTDKKIVLDSKEKSSEKKSQADIVIMEVNQSVEKIVQNEISDLDALLLEVENNMVNDIVGHDTLVLQALTIDTNWEESSKEEDVLETARNFLGVKYIWAANGPYSFDCSGFTKYVFKKNGIRLPRYSGHQANMGTKIKFSEMQKGDLVFFDTTKKFSGKVNHVGIFAGDDQFIHASSGGKKVMMTSFSEKKFYKNKFLYARRIINNSESIAFNFHLKNTN